MTRVPAIRFLSLGFAALTLAGLATACGSKPKAAPASPGGSSGTGMVCQPVAGNTLVTLADDKKLQLSDNIVPLVRTAVAKAPLTDALNKVSSVLSQQKLNALNAAVSTQHEPSEQAASDFVSQNGLGSGFSGGSGTINVVAANFSENQTLAYIYADVLNAAGYKANVKISTNREAYLKALEAGQYDVVPEYAATLTEFLNTAANGANAPTKASSDITQTMAALKPLAEAKGLTALDPATATDQDAFAVTENFANKYHVSTLSELASTCSGGITLGGPVECPQRPFCEEGLKKTYGLKITSFTPLDSDGSLTRSAVEQGRVALVEVFSSDSDVKPAS
ncbi:MAG TPA: glycine betaine ABC transporter substrate-binding protein [Mycobacteriales bacterium]